MVFSLDLKTDSESLLMTDAGSEFQTDGTAHRKERFAKLVRANGWIYAFSTKHDFILMVMMMMMMCIQELRSMHEELVKQKTGFQSRIQTRDEEIGRLRSQVRLQ